jgi:hypothetical protein
LPIILARIIIATATTIASRAAAAVLYYFGCGHEARTSSCCSTTTRLDLHVFIYALAKNETRTSNGCSLLESGPLYRLWIVYVPQRNRVLQGCIGWQGMDILRSYQDNSFLCSARNQSRRQPATLRRHTRNRTGRNNKGYYKQTNVTLMIADCVWFIVMEVCSYCT